MVSRRPHALLLPLLLAVLLVLAACGEDGAEPPAAERPVPTPEAPEATPEDDGGDEAGEGVLADDRWTALADAPLALTEVAGAAFGGALWIAGGFDADGQAVDTVLVYDPRFDRWEEGPPLPRALHHAALVSSGDALYLIGGYAGAGFDTPVADVAVFEAASAEWTTGPPLPAARAAGAAAWDGERIVYGGGVGPDGVAGDVWAFDGERWVDLEQLGTAREHLAAASDGEGRTWFLGGRTGGLDTNLADVDLVRGPATTAVGELPTARGGVAGLHLPGAGACALGGEGSQGTFTEVECLDADGAVTSLPALGEGRHGLAADLVEGVAYAALGGPEPGLHVSAALEALAAPGR